MPWLTPDTIPIGGEVCRLLVIPADVYLIAAVTGALYELTFPKNWEPFGEKTPDETADAMADMLAAYMESDCGGGGMAVGTIFPYITTNPPIDSVACDGSIYADTDYPAIWDVIDEGWKTDSTHWQAPDLRDRFPVGAGNLYEAGDTGGESTHSLTAAENGPHTHGLYLGISGTTGNLYPPPSRPTSIQNAYSGAVISSGSGTAHENRPPFLALKWAVSVG